MWLKVLSGEDAGRTAEITGGTFVLGRVQGSDLVIRDVRASRRHAELTTLPDGRVSLRDLSSANGTQLNGQPVTEAVLRGGEELQIGSVRIAVLADAPRDRPSTPTYSMVGRLVESRTRATRRTTYAALAAAAAGLAGVAALLTGVLGNGGDPVPAVVKRLARSTVLVETLTDDRRTGTGSGWVLDADAGLIVTNAHVVNEGVRYRVGAGGRLRDAALVGNAPCEDLAVLRVRDTQGLRSAPLGALRTVEQGETVVALGYPVNASAEDELASTRGVVSVVRTAYREPAPDLPAYPDAIETDTALNPGNSGGPLVDLDGRVVGVNAAARTTGAEGRTLQGQGYAIGIDRVRQIAAELRLGRSRAWTGATFGYPSVEELAQRELPAGLYLTGAVPRTPAARAGLGDGAELLVGVDGRAIGATLSDYCRATAGLLSGRRVTLNVLRAGSRKPREVVIKLA